MSDTKCLQCHRKTELFLCETCTNELCNMLDSLVSLGTLDDGRPTPGWLEYLEDAALGFTKLGESERRSSDKTTPMPVNLKASEIYCDTVKTLRLIGRVIGITSPGFTPITLAAHLANNVDKIAKSQLAAEHFAAIQKIVHRIEALINRPKPPRVLGPCPRIVDDEKGGTTSCGTALTAPHNATEVQCPCSKNTFNVNELLALQLQFVDDKSFTISELHREVLPKLEEYVSLRTLQEWAARSRMTPTGYNAKNEARYMLAHVRELRAARKHKQKTGAAAHKKAGAA